MNYNIMKYGLGAHGSFLSLEISDLKQALSRYCDVFMQMITLALNPNRWSRIIGQFPEEERDKAIEQLSNGEFGMAYRLFVDTFRELVRAYNSYIPKYQETMQEPEDKETFDEIMGNVRKQIIITNTLFHPMTRDEFLGNMRLEVEPVTTYIINPEYLERLFTINPRMY